MLNIHIKTIPHGAQRYPTVGDYYREKHKQHIRISDLQDKDYEFLVAIHELIESYLCERRKIDWEAIDRFDIEYERNRPPGDVSEPGDHPKAPYHKEHRIATIVEMLLSHELGVNWAAYEKKVDSL